MHFTHGSSRRPDLLCGVPACSHVRLLFFSFSACASHSSVLQHQITQAPNKSQNCR
uniref:Uncharacterized protein n=1 Tax=Arundo donax TaxID=35708 RepID=A0A0A9HGX7_ARUDO